MPEFAVKDLPWAEHSANDDDDDDMLLGRRVIEISGSLIWSKTLVKPIFKPCGEFR